MGGPRDEKEQAKERSRGMTNEILKPGDPCPCCGQPIKTSDPEKMLLLSWIALLEGGKPNE